MTKNLLLSLLATLCFQTDILFGQHQELQSVDSLDNELLLLEGENLQTVIQNLSEIYPCDTCIFLKLIVDTFDYKDKDKLHFQFPGRIITTSIEEKAKVSNKVIVTDIYSGIAYYHCSDSNEVKRGLPIHSNCGELFVKNFSKQTKTNLMVRSKYTRVPGRVFVCPDYCTLVDYQLDGNKLINLYWGAALQEDALSLDLYLYNIKTAKVLEYKPE